MTSLLSRTIDALARARSPEFPVVPGVVDSNLEGHLERPSCALCGHTRARLVVVGEDTWVAHGHSGRQRFQVVRCEVCAHRYTTPRFRRVHRTLAYDASYPFYVRAKRARAGEPELRQEAARRPFEGRADRLSKYAGNAGRLLDLGAGDGFFVDVMQRRGWSGQGIDFDPDVVWYAAERLGLDVWQGDIEQDALPDGPFDAVSLWGVLQLAYEPRELLLRVHKILGSEGILAVGVSNIRSVGAHLFGSRWRGLGLPRHLSHFTPDTIRRLLEWSGFVVRGWHFETPRWVVAGSVDAFPIPGRRAAKAALYGAAHFWGQSTWADTFEVYASPRS